jgi:hypothetical protein
LWVWLGAIPSPLPDWQTWSLQDIAARAMVGGDAMVSAWSMWARPLVLLVGLFTVAAFIQAGRLSRPRGSGAATFMLAYALLNLAVVHALWLYNDRYFLVFAPTIVWLAAQWCTRVVVRPALVWTLLACMAAVSISGTRDMLDVNEACATAARDLEAAGVPAWDIDAGYASNGWRLYVHPENLPRGADRRYEVPFVTSKTPTTYKVANGPLDGYEIVREIPLEHAWWQATDRLYVLRRLSAREAGAKAPVG